MSNEDNQLETNSVVLNDDCCELVFEYLTLEDKCRLERVSEQFKKLIFLKQTKLELIICSILTDIDEKYVVLIDRLECLLKKCSNLRRIDSYEVLVNDRVLDVITDCCQRLIEIHFFVNDVTKEAIIRFSEKLGHKLKYIHIYDYQNDSSLENQQLLFDLCPDLTSINCQHFLTLNVIASKHLKKLKLMHKHLWSDTEIQAFGRFVNTNNNNLIYLVVITDIDIYHHSNDILRHVCRMTNLKVFIFMDESIESIQIQVQSFKDLVPFCKKLQKVKCYVNIDNFDLWQTFRDFDALKELTIDFSYYNCLGSILIDTKKPINQLPTLKKLFIECQSIGDYFFSDITKFSPYLEVLKLLVNRPRYQFSNQSLTALSECKRLKDLRIKFPPITTGNDIEYPIVDDIGLIPLIENCKQLKRIRFEFSIDSLIDSISKWMEIISDSPKRSITFESYFLCENTKTVLSDMSLLESLKSLHFNNDSDYIQPFRDKESIRVIFDKSMSISVFITVKLYIIEKFDFWVILSRYINLQRLEFNIAFNSFYESKVYIEPMMELKEITLNCHKINDHFFVNITKLAPNVEVLELALEFKFKNEDLIKLSQLKKLNKIRLNSTEKKEYSVDDIGVIQLLDNCQKLRQVILDFEVNITSASIDKLKQMANQIINSERPKDMIRFECFVSSSELQSNRLKSLPKNLIIRTKLLINK